MKPGGKGDEPSFVRSEPRGGRLDGPGRLFGRPEASDRPPRAV